MQTDATQQLGFLDKIKGWLHGLLQKLHLSKDTLIDMGMYLVAGFLAGFLFKRYFEYIILLVIFIIGLALLSNFNLVTISINWAQVQSLLGFQSATTAANASLLTVFWEWIKMNLLVVFSFSIGFLIGLRLG